MQSGSLFRKYLMSTFGCWVVAVQKDWPCPALRELQALVNRYVEHGGEETGRVTQLRPNAARH